MTPPGAPESRLQYYRGMLRRLRRRAALERAMGGSAHALFFTFNMCNQYLRRRTGFGFPFIIQTLVREPAFEPVGIRNTDDLFYFLREVDVEVAPALPQTVNIFLPTIEPSIIFGGYIALFSFARKLLDAGIPLRFIVTDLMASSVAKVRRTLGEKSTVTYCLVRSEVRYLPSEPLQVFGPRDRFVGYSWATMRKAADAAAKTNGSLPVFFIQEYEPIFYPYDSIRALAHETYGIPHVGVFNSDLLADYFLTRGIGRYDGAAPIVFRHAITKMQPPALEELRGRATRRLLFYARPEAHAARNLFELGFLAIARAIREGVFDPRWEFHGIGLGFAMDDMELHGTGVKMRMVRRLDLDGYKRFVGGCDLGLSLMYSPHPSVPPYEMAAAGLATVTNTCENKTAEVLAGICGNLVPCELSIDGIVAGLRRAAARVEDHPGRIAGARLNWPTSWDESFNPAVMESFLRATGLDRRQD